MNSTQSGSPGMPTPASEAVLRPLTPQDPRQIGRYLLRARIGEGGMGAVYLSYTPGARPVALKVARPEFASDLEFRRRFASEVAIAQRVQGLYTVPVIDCDPHAPQPWLATGYIAAPSLAAAVARQGALPPETVLVLIAGVAEALHSIHAAGVIHRDLKPGNIILGADGPHVIDFGISRAVEASSMAITRTGARIGTPAFMAPEQVQGRSLGAAGDIFSLGSTAYYAITGELPFGADAAVFHRIEHRQPDWDRCPDQVRGVLERCLEKEPTARPTPAALIELCRAASTDERLRIGEGWLPSTLTAELTRYVLTEPLTLHENEDQKWPSLTFRGVGAATLVAIVILFLILSKVLSDDDAAPPTGSGPPSAGAPSAGSSPGSPSPVNSPAATIVAREQLGMQDGADATSADYLPLTVHGIDNGSYSPRTLMVRFGQISTDGRIVAWPGSGEPTANECYSLLRTQPLSVLDNQTGLRFCAVGGLSSRIAAGHVLSYGNGVSQIQITVWNVKFDS